MNTSKVVMLAWTILSPLTYGHGYFAGTPRLFGRKSVGELRSRQRSAPFPHQPHDRHIRTRSATDSAIKKRANTDGQCGPNYGSCAAGYCCSPAGWCGTTEDYCAAPDCQFNYGSGCDTLQVPPGVKTSGVARTKVGSVPYGGVGIYDCTAPGVIALTFDDGPYIYTSHILDILDKYNVKATFFIAGNNLGKGQIDDAATPWPGVIQRMYASGHQIASHTWGHQDLSSLSQSQRLAQMYNNEIAFNNILGLFPTYMRPPYSSCTTDCENDLGSLGYHIIYFDLDTEDYLHDDPNEIQISKNDFLGNISSQNPAAGGDWLVISHDIHLQTAYNLTEYMIQTLISQKYTPVTVGQCLGDPAENWYRTLGGGSLFTSGTFTYPSTPPATFTTSTIGTISTGQSSTSSSKGISSSKSGSSIKSFTSKPLTSTISSSNPKPTSVSPDGTCGGSQGHTCQNSSFGNCCSENGWCGSSFDYCLEGCQAAFGSCSSTQGEPSQDGTCGGSVGYVCSGSTFGTCCSSSGWCGDTSDYCDANFGCQTSFGVCS